MVRMLAITGIFLVGPAFVSAHADIAAATAPLAETAVTILLDRA